MTFSRTPAPNLSFTNFVWSSSGGWEGPPVLGHLPGSTQGAREGPRMYSHLEGNEWI